MVGKNFCKFLIYLADIQHFTKYYNSSRMVAKIWIKPYQKEYGLIPEGCEANTIPESLIGLTERGIRWGA